jgi:hypothetical protein
MRFYPAAKFVPYRKSCTRTHSREIPTASDVPPRHTSRGFLHWRLSDDGPGASRIVPIGRHPKPFTKPEVVIPSRCVTPFIQEAKQLQGQPAGNSCSPPAKAMEGGCPETCVYIFPVQRCIRSQTN